MKARTICPKCKHEFVMDAPDDSETCEVSCPKCSHKFEIKQASSDESESTKECGWEEHGEPRKTILSSLKPHTNKPMIASFLLLASCVLGVFTAVLIISSKSDNLIIPCINLRLDFLTGVIGHIGLSIVVIIFSIFAFVGFVTTLKRRYLEVAAICAFLAIFSIGFFVGIVLSIAALVLIISAKEEFENATKGKVF